MKSKYSPLRTAEERREFWYNSDGLRRCCTCAEFFPIDAFHNDKKGIDGKTFRCRACVAVYQRQHYRGNESRKQRTNERNIENYYKRKYGLTKADKASMLSLQGGVCAICRKSHNLMHVDHDHTTGKVRGILCTNCNRGIGHLQEDTTILNNAIHYLREHSEDVVIASEGSCP